MLLRELNIAKIRGRSKQKDLQKKIPKIVKKATAKVMDKWNEFLGMHEKSKGFDEDSAFQKFIEEIFDTSFIYSGEDKKDVVFDLVRKAAEKKYSTDFEKDKAPTEIPVGTKFEFVSKKGNKYIVVYDGSKWNNDKLKSVDGPVLQNTITKAYYSSL